MYVHSACMSSARGEVVDDDVEERAGRVDRVSDAGTSGTLVADDQRERHARGGESQCDQAVVERLARAATVEMVGLGLGARDGVGAVPRLAGRAVFGDVAERIDGPGL